MFKAVLFDLDNTLVDRDGAFRACVQAHFRDPAVRAELLALDGGGRGGRAALFNRWQQPSGAEMNQSKFGALLAERVRPDAALIDMLVTLSQAVKLGVITNGSSETQRLKFHAAGLARAIPEDRLWISEEVGCAKPDPAIFLIASHALGESVGDCLYVGDHEPDDMVGATAAGMRGRLVDSVLNAERLGKLLAAEGMR